MRNLLILCTFLTLHLLSCTSREQRLTAEGNALIIRIDSFHQATHRLPENLSELGIEEKMEGPLYYQKLTPDHYMIHFGTDLGESMIYRSESKTWRDY